MNRTLVAAIDQGTTGTRLMLYDSGGRIVARAVAVLANALPIASVALMAL